MSGPRLAAPATLRGSQNRSTAPAVPTAANFWSVAQIGSIVEVGYGSGSDFPQYAALHTDSSFLRLNCGPGSAWGTSIILLPSFWAAGSYFQGAPITAAWRNEGTDLVMSFMGSISGLQAQGQIRLTPPAPNFISGTLIINVEGFVNLDRRPGEAFKPVALSSMHISANQCDAHSAEVDSQSFPIPAHGWIIQPPAVGRLFALRGGSSTWKTNAPTLEILLNEPLEITGWETESSNPDGDNIGFWATTDQLIRSWQYTVIAKP
jgi:hypothetical protein